MILRAPLLALLVGLLSCRETPREPAPAEVLGPAPEVAAPDPDDELAGVFPPVWRLGDHWQVTMVTETERSMTLIGYSWGKTYGYVVYEFRVAEVPVSDAGFYRLTALSVRADDPAFRGFHVYYRKKPFSFERIVELRDDGEPHDSPAWQRSREDEPQPEVHRELRFISDFPIMPDPPRLGESTYRSGGLVRPSVQRVERTADGLRFTITPAWSERTRSVMDWKRGAKWWSSLGRFSLDRGEKPEQHFDGTGLLLE